MKSLFIIIITLFLYKNCVYSFTPPLVHNCSSDYDCTPFSVCKQLGSDGHKPGTCNCIVGYEPSRDGNTCVQTVCSDNADCDEQHKNSVCNFHFSKTFCECAGHFKAVKNKESCILRKNVTPLREQCKFGSDCGYRAECLDQICQCSFGSKETEDGVNCLAVQCTKNSDCKGIFNNLACNTTIQKCYKLPPLCEVGYSPKGDEERKSCQQIVCKKDADCLLYHENTFCNSYQTPSSHCECISNFELEQNKKNCVPQKYISRLGGTCKYHTECGDHTECQINNHKCQCKSGSMPKRDGLNCAPVGCDNNAICTAIDEEWSCNTKISECYKTSSNNSKKFNEKTQSITNFIFLIFVNILVLIYSI